MNVTRIAALSLATLLGPAAAANAATLDTLGCPAEEVKVVVLGDSLADGLWGSFFRAFARCETMSVLRRTTVSDGLTKTAPDEWISRLGPEAEGADLIVVQIGANDITNIREGTTRHLFGSEEWRAAYAGRTKSLVDELKGHAPEVVWMGLPIVGRGDFEESYREITALQAEAASASGATFVDTHEPTTFGVGEFVMTAEWDGTVRQMRVQDQVHFTELGYDVVAGLLTSRVAQLFAAREGGAAMDALALQ